MHENRSFDHYFGTYRGRAGIRRPGALRDLRPGMARAVAGADPTLLPFHLDTPTSDAECTYDLSHAWDAQHLCWNNGAMDRFVATHTSATVRRAARTGC